MTEHDVHKAVVQHLRAYANPGAVWWHTPNSGNLPVQYRVKLKAMGLRAGVSDLICLCNGEAFALELKKDSGRSTESQLEFLDAWRAAGGHGVVAEGLDEALACIKAWGWVK
jgi:hypothetical protein